MTRFARGFKKKHIEASSWDELQGSKGYKESASNDEGKEKVEKSTKEVSKIDIKEEKKKEARRRRRSMKKICFHCRKPGHSLSLCPSMKTKESPVDICFKCGSTQHRIQECNVKVPKDDYPFAKCFVCGKNGHISKQCPENPRGLYPLGGGCKFCGSVEHFKRDCPESRTSNTTETVTARVVEKREINDWTSVDAVAFSEEEDNNDANRYPVKTKKPKVVKF